MVGLSRGFEVSVVEVFFAACVYKTFLFNSSTSFLDRATKSFDAPKHSPLWREFLIREMRCVCLRVH